MFFRIKTTRSGEALQLVESYCNREGKPRQRIVVSLAQVAKLGLAWDRRSQPMDNGTEWGIRTQPSFAGTESGSAI
ncbi:MAG: hypothetical protein R6V56_07315 [Lentisphaeria bacterium]